MAAIEAMERGIVSMLFPDSKELIAAACFERRSHQSTRVRQFRAVVPWHELQAQSMKTRSPIHPDLFLI
jgi:hypothetical protein